MLYLIIDYIGLSEIIKLHVNMTLLQFLLKNSENKMKVSIYFKVQLGSVNRRFTTKMKMVYIDLGLINSSFNMAFVAESKVAKFILLRAINQMKTFIAPPRSAACLRILENVIKSKGSHINSINTLTTLRWHWIYPIPISNTCLLY